MAEKTLEERLSELYEKIDHRDQFFDKDLKTLIDGIRDAREHGGTASVDVTPIVGGYKIVIIDSEGVEHVATVKDGGDAYEVYKSTVPEGQSPMTKEEWLETLKGADGADGQDGQDGAPGHNPCLGRFTTLPTLSPNTFEDAQTGDYLYYDTTDPQTSDPVTYIYHFNGTNWDSGTVIDAEHPTFASGQAVTSVHIKNLYGEDDPDAQGVLSVEAGRKLNNEKVSALNESSDNVFSICDQHGNVIAKINNGFEITPYGHIKIKDGFDSSHITPTDTSDCAKIGNDRSAPFTISDGNGNIIAKISKGFEITSNGHIKIKDGFDSSHIDVEGDAVEVILPERINVVIGDNLQLFYRSCVKANNIDDYNIYVKGENKTVVIGGNDAIVGTIAQGKALTRYYQFTPNENCVGQHFNLTIEIRDNENVKIAEGFTEIYVIDKASNPLTKTNILVIGASVVSAGHITSELERRLTTTTGENNSFFNPKGLGLNNIAFVGRKEVSVNLARIYKPKGINTPYWEYSTVETLDVTNSGSTIGVCENIVINKNADINTVELVGCGLQGGSVICNNKTIRSVKTIIGSFNIPISSVTFTLKQNNQNGTILAQKTVSISNTNKLKSKFEIECTFDNDVTYSGDIYAMYVINLEDSVSIHQEATGGWGWFSYLFTGGERRYRFYIADGSGDVSVNSTATVNGITLKVEEKNITDGSGNISCSYTGTLSGTLSETGTLYFSDGTNVNYSSFVLDATNPFYNPNNRTIDFSNYVTKYLISDGQMTSGEKIDVMISQLGVNNMAGETWSLDGILGNIRTFVNHFLDYNPNGKFIISTIALPDPTGGMGTNYKAVGNGSNWYTIANRFMEFSKAIEELSLSETYAGKIFHAPVLQVSDCEHMYPKTLTNVNNRDSEQEFIGSNAYHPEVKGHLLIADGIYGELTYVLNNQNE